MAERLDHFTPRTGGAERKYPWDAWMDGSAWRIVRGEDYVVPSTSMASMIRLRARGAGMHATATLIHEPDGVEFQFSQVPNGAAA